MKIKILLPALPRAMQHHTSAFVSYQVFGTKTKETAKKKKIKHIVTKTEADLLKKTNLQDNKSYLRTSGKGIMSTATFSSHASV